MGKTITMTSRSWPDRRSLAWFAILSVAYIALSVSIAAKQEDPFTYDAPSFLALAAEIRHEGGCGVLLRDLFTGRYRLSNQHPLYPAILSFVAENGAPFWPRAKLVTVFLSYGAVLALFLAGHRLFGATESMIATTLLAFGHRWLDHATQVTVDPMLVLFTILAWWACVEDLEQDGRLSAWAGAAVGLAYLTKANGIYMAPAWFIGILALGGPRALFSRRVLLFLMGFALVAAPLIWRNTLVYGFPFYNDNANYLWTHRWSDSWDLAFIEQPATFTSYLAEHGWSGILDRYTRGVLAVYVWLMECMRTITLNGTWTWWLTVPYVLAALMASAWDVRRSRGVVSLVFILINWFFFAWWIFIFFEARFVFPLLPLLLLYGASALTSLAERWNLTRPLRLFCLYGTGTTLAAMTAILVFVPPLHNSSTPPKTLSAPEIRWFDERLPAERRLYGRMAPIHAAQERAREQSRERE